MPSNMFTSIIANLRNRTNSAAGKAGGVKTASTPGAVSTGSRSEVNGRVGIGLNSAVNAQGSGFQLKETFSGGDVATRVLTTDSDWIGMVLGITVTPTGNTSTSTDILTALGQLQILDKDGSAILCNPSVDFYDFAQRFTPTHIRPSVVNSDAATAVSGTYYVPFNLPLEYGPYTIIQNFADASSFGTSTTAISTSYELQLIPGVAPYETRFSYSNLPFTPASDGVNDLAPLATIQEHNLDELFLSGLTSNTADISFMTISSAGNMIANRVTSGYLVTKANAIMNSTLPTTELFPLLALGTSIQLGRSSHLYMNWGSSPSSSIRVGYFGHR